MKANNNGTVPGNLEADIKDLWGENVTVIQDPDNDSDCQKLKEIAFDGEKCQGFGEPVPYPFYPTMEEFSDMLKARSIYIYKTVRYCPMEIEEYGPNTGTLVVFTAQDGTESIGMLLDVYFQWEEPSSKPTETVLSQPLPGIFVIHTLDQILTPQGTPSYYLPKIIFSRGV